MKQVADKRRTERSFEVGEQVYLKVRRFLQQPYTTILASKLSPKYFGPFPILGKVGVVAYRLQLLEGVQVHLVFHVSLLKPIKGPLTNVSTTLPLIAEQLEEEVEPRAIVEKRVIYWGSLPITQVHVQWTHRPPKHTTWENLLELLQHFPKAVGLL